MAESSEDDTGQTNMSSGSSSNSNSEEEEEDVKCLICNGEKSSKKNQIVLCDGKGKATTKLP